MDSNAKNQIPTEDISKIFCINSYRCQPIKEGWWIKEFPKTELERQKALSLFSSVRQ